MMRSFLSKILHWRYFPSFALLAFGAAPCVVFVLNSKDLDSPFYRLPVWAALIIVMLILLPLIATSRMQKFADWARPSLVIICGYLLVRIFFFPVNYQWLDGNETVIVGLASDDSIIGTILIVAVLALLWKFASKVLQNAVDMGILISCGFIVFALGKHLLTTEIAQTGGALDYAQLSRQSNLVVISLDSVQGDVFDELLASDAALRNALDGFTHFSDVSSFAPNTAFSILSTLTGYALPSGDNGESIDTLTEKLRSRSILEKLNTEGFETATHGISCSLSPASSCFNYSSVVEADGSLQTIDALDIAMFRTLPKSLSGRVLELLDITHPATNDLMDQILNDEAGHGFGFDYLAFNYFVEELNLPENNADVPVARFYHFLHTHQPIRFDSSCQFDIDESNQNLSAATEEIFCAARQTISLIQKMKKLGVFDQSLIVITSDHGYESNIQPPARNDSAYFGGLINENGIWSASRYWPILLVKLPGAKPDSLIRSELPVSLLDLARLICDSFLAPDQCAEYTERRLQDSATTLRPVMIFSGGPDGVEEMHTNSRLFKQHTIGKNVFASLPGAMLDPLASIDFTSTSTSPRFVSSGLSRAHEQGTWTDNDIVDISFFSETSRPTGLSITTAAFANVHNPVVTASVFVNGSDLGKIMFDAGSGVPPSAETFTFDWLAPTDFDGRMDLKLQIEGSASPAMLGLSKDDRTLGLRLIRIDVSE